MRGAGPGRMPRAVPWWPEPARPLCRPPVTPTGPGGGPTAPHAGRSHEGDPPPEPPFLKLFPFCLKSILSELSVLAPVTVSALHGLIPSWLADPAATSPRQGGARCGGRGGAQGLPGSWVPS